MGAGTWSAAMGHGPLVLQFSPPIETSMGSKGPSRWRYFRCARGTLAVAAVALLPKVLDLSCKAHVFRGACDEAMCLFGFGEGDEGRVPPPIPTAAANDVPLQPCNKKV